MSDVERMLTELTSARHWATPTEWEEMLTALRAALAAATAREGELENERVAAFRALLPECSAHPGVPNTCHPEMCDCMPDTRLPAVIEVARAEERAEREAAVLAVREQMAEHVRCAMQALPDDVALRMGDPGCDDDLARQEAEALSAGCETGEVARVIAKSRASRAVRARDTVAKALTRSFAATPMPPLPTPTPAPASGEEDGVIVKALVIAAKRWERSKDYGAGEKLEAFERRVVDRLARLTRELAEARAELVKTQELLGISVSRTTAARAEAARLRGALEQVVGIADSTANAWDRDDVRDEYRRGQVRGAVDAARPAVRALGGTDA